jgi:hypothetical protein
MVQKRQKRRIGFDLQIVGDLVGLPQEPALGTVYRVRGGEHDGITVEHHEAGWFIEGADGEPLVWFEVLRLLLVAPDVMFEVVKVANRCALPGCIQAVTGRQIFCKPAHQVAAGRLDGRWSMGH